MISHTSSNNLDQNQMSKISMQGFHKSKMKQGSWESFIISSSSEDAQ